MSQISLISRLSGAGSVTCSDLQGRNRRPISYQDHPVRRLARLTVGRSGGLTEGQSQSWIGG